jgi:hypothetical protein
VGDKATHEVRCRVAAIDVYDDTDADVWLKPLSDDVTLVDTYQAEWIDMPEVMPPESERVPGAVLWAPRSDMCDWASVVDDLRACAVEGDAYVVAHLECERVRESYEYGKVRHEYHGRCVRVDIVRREEE